LSVTEIALEIALGLEQSDSFGFGDEHVSNALPADRVAGAINLRNLRDGFLISSGQFKLRIDVSQPEVARARLRKCIELLPAHLLKRNNRFGGGENGAAYGNAYANPASPDMKTAKNTAGRKQTHTDNPLAMMKINGEPALVVELRSGSHALKHGSTIKRKDVKCHFYSLKKECRKFDYDEDGLQGSIDLITAANA